MSRMTIRNSDGTVSQPTDLRWNLALEKLAGYEDAEEEGRMVIFPSKPETINLKRAAELILADEQGRLTVRPSGFLDECVELVLALRRLCEAGVEDADDKGVCLTQEAFDRHFPEAAEAAELFTEDGHPIGLALRNAVYRDIEFDTFKDLEKEDRQ